MVSTVFVCAVCWNGRADDSTEGVLQYVFILVWLARYTVVAYDLGYNMSKPVIGLLMPFFSVQFNGHNWRLVLDKLRYTHVI